MSFEEIVTATIKQLSQRARKDIMIMKEFRQDNTEGYTDDQLKIFNYDWNERIIFLKLEPDTDEYNFQLKCFRDHIARK